MGPGKVLQNDMNENMLLCLRFFLTGVSLDVLKVQP